jgi:Delta7-sterol 5-desaturase
MTAQLPAPADLSVLSFMGVVFLFFLGIYVVIAGAGDLLAWYLRRAGIAPACTNRPDGGWRQRRREMALSGCNIVLFALGASLVWVMDASGVSPIRRDPSAWQVLSTTAALIVLNEVHFYLIHRVLHVGPLMRAIHVEHHRSRTPTAWAAFRFHPVEGLLLGSIMPCGMLLVTVDVVSLIILPIYSLLVNVAAHSNCDLWLLPRHVRGHTRHHQGGHGDYGFLSGLLDRALRTRP